MRILQMAPYFTPYVGGQERYVHNLSKYLVKYGDEVDVATSNYPKSNEFEIVDGFEVHRFRCLARPMRNPIAPALFELKDVIDDYDIIHTHNEHAFSALVASRLSVKHGVPLVLTCHGQLTFGNSFLDLIEKTYMHTIARGIFGRVDAICVNSPLDKDYISRFVPASTPNIWQVSNAVDPDHLSQLRGGFVRDEISKFVESPSYKVLFVGSLIKRKGVDTLVRAMKRLTAAAPEEDICLLMVGDGIERQNLLRMVAESGLQDRVHLVGSVSDVELACLYEASDVLALPSLSEVCPTVVLEAMYFGLPVIATDIPGVRDHFKDTAWLVAPNDEAMLAEAILGLVKDQDLSAWMRSIGNGFVLRNYTWDKIARDYQSIYRQVSKSFGTSKRWTAVGSGERRKDYDDTEVVLD